MEVTRRSKLVTRLQNYVFMVSFLAAIGLLAWLSTRYVMQADWTAGGRNTLAEDSQQLLDELDGPVTITAYVTQDRNLRRHIEDLVGRYQRYYPDTRLQFVNPDAEPDRVRAERITVDGELVISYQGRSEHVQRPAEQALSNALLRVARQGERWIVFITGHGERNPHGQANHDLGTFGKELERKGLKVQSLNLAQNPSVPKNAHVLVIASPQVDLLPGETKLISDYVDNGGNLFWMMEPGQLHGLDALAEDLGIELLPGIVVDATTQLFGIQNPDFALVVEYPLHAITRELNVMTLFPRAAALELNDSGDWNGRPLLTTLARAWTETGELVDEISYDEGGDERIGPLDIGFVLSRNHEQENGDDSAGPMEQRVVVLGDGDFISNTYAGNGGNVELGLNIIDWLSHDDEFIAIRPKAAPDQNLTLSNTAQVVIGIGFLFVLPLLLLFTGLIIWLRRRKR